MNIFMFIIIQFRFEANQMACSKWVLITYKRLMTWPDLAKNVCISGLKNSPANAQASFNNSYLSHLKKLTPKVGLRHTNVFASCMTSHKGAFYPMNVSYLCLLSLLLPLNCPFSIHCCFGQNMLAAFNYSNCVTGFWRWWWWCVCMGWGVNNV